MTGGASLGASVESADARRASALDQCDRLLGEIGRREHRFAWLRAPGSGRQDWLAVDAYYPANRVVVCCQRDPETRAVCAALVPSHGLHLLSFDLAELGADAITVEEVVRDHLRRSGSTRQAPHPGPTPLRAALPAVPRSTEHDGRFGVAIGTAVSAIVLAETFLGAIVLGIDRGQLVLGLGVLLDAAARALGTISAGHEGDHHVAWASLSIGSPLVATRGHAESGEPGHIARIVAHAALVIIAVGIVLAFL